MKKLISLFLAAVLILSSFSVDVSAASTKPKKVKVEVNDGVPTVTWKAVSGATKYKVYKYSLEERGWVKVGTTKKTSFTDNTAKLSESVVTYGVKAYVKVNGKKKWSKLGKSEITSLSPKEDPNRHTTHVTVTLTKPLYLTKTEDPTSPMIEPDGNVKVKVSFDLTCGYEFPYWDEDMVFSLYEMPDGSTTEVFNRLSPAPADGTKKRTCFINMRWPSPDYEDEANYSYYPKYDIALSETLGEKAACVITDQEKGTVQFVNLTVGWINEPLFCNTTDIEPAGWVEGPFRVGLSISSFGSLDSLDEFIEKINPTITNFSYERPRCFKYNSKGELKEFIPKE